MVNVEPGLLKLGILPEWPTEKDFGEDFTREAFFASEFVPACTSTRWNYLPSAIYRTPDGRLVSYNFLGRSARDYANAFTEDLSDAFDSAFANDFPTSLAGGFATEFTGFVGHRIRTWKPLSIESASFGSGNRSALKVVAPPSADLAASLSATPLVHETEITAWQDALAYRLAAEAWIALVTAIDQPRDERTGYAQHRAQNAWLLHVWPALDERLGEEPSTDALALYLGLGWTQATTTWQWPATEHWIRLLSAEPPNHWLLRSQWHLCWLLHNRADSDHRRALEEALEEGLTDEGRPGVAASLRSTLLGLDE